ncbi:MAG TPA: SH3 domain-containing protein [Flavobacterium sp.]|nr:SH3 domain-containing protein [Flavobacterium sp.]
MDWTKNPGFLDKSLSSALSLTELNFNLQRSIDAITAPVRAFDTISKLSSSADMYNHVRDLTANQSKFVDLTEILRNIGTPFEQNNGVGGALDTVASLGLIHQNSIGKFSTYSELFSKVTTLDSFFRDMTDLTNIPKFPTFEEFITVTDAREFFGVELTEEEVTQYGNQIDEVITSVQELSEAQLSPRELYKRFVEFQAKVKKIVDENFLLALFVFVLYDLVPKMFNSAADHPVTVNNITVNNYSSQPLKEVFIVASKTPIRSKARNDYKPFDTLEVGTKLLIEEVSPKWARVKCFGSNGEPIEGWIRKDGLE